MDNLNELREEASRCYNCKNASCKEACPLKNDIPNIMHNVAIGDLDKAYEINLKTNPLGAICGLICPHEKLCEGACIQLALGEAVKIGKVESMLCLSQLDNNKTNIAKNDLDESMDKVAIIGGGPARIILRLFLITKRC